MKDKLSKWLYEHYGYFIFPAIYILLLYFWTAPTILFTCIAIFFYFFIKHTQKQEEIERLKRKDINNLTESELETLTEDNINKKKREKQMEDLGKKAFDTIGKL